MRVAVKFVCATGEDPMRLAGAFVTHGLSSRQAMDAIQMLKKTDITVELRDTLAAMNNTFNKYGLTVEEVLAEDNAPPMRAISA